MASAAVSPLLTATDLGKCYRLYARPIDRFTELVLGRRRHQEFWALKGIHLTLLPGTSVGIIGENGSGKSTLLKLIAGVLTPTSGSIRVNGRVASIIELGMGFHPEFSGLENLFVGGALLGLSRRQIEAKIPEIAEFSELGGFLSRPLKSYSTGMSMRLAFSLAASVEPDLLIVDEALAVGDGHFQKKCVDRVRTFQEQGGGLLFCSHSMYQVSMLCREVLWLRAGQVAAYGPVPQVIAAYEAYLEAKEEKPSDLHHYERHTGGELTEIHLEGGSRNGAGLIVTWGTEVNVRVRWRGDTPERLFHVGVVIDRVDNLTCFATTTLKDRLPAFSGRTDYATTVRFPALPLASGTFRVKVFLLDQHGIYAYDQKITEQTLTIATEEQEWGICHLDHVWETGQDGD